MDGESRISITKSLVTLVVLLTAGLSIFLVAICLDKNPFVLQITSIFGYTAGVLYLVFCDSRYWRGYSLRRKEVQRELPRLVSMHMAFLVFLVVVETIALWARPHLPSYWRSEYGVAVGIVQVLVALWIAGADSAARGAFEEADSIGYRFRGCFRSELRFGGLLDLGYQC